MASIKKTAGLTTMYYASSVLLRTTGEDEEEGKGTEITVWLWRPNWQFGRSVPIRRIGFSPPERKGGREGPRGGGTSISVGKVVPAEADGDGEAKLREPEHDRHLHSYCCNFGRLFSAVSLAAFACHDKGP